MIYFILILTLSSCSYFQEETENKKELAQLHLQIGTGYLTRGNNPLAIKELKLAESFDPENTSILNNLGLAYFVRGEHTLAEGKLLKALQIDSNYTEARSNLARVYMAQKNYAKAIVELKTASKDLTYIKPERVWTNLGLAYFQDQKYELAEEALKKSLTLSRNYCPAYTLLGRSYYERNLYRKAAFTLDQAVFKCKEQVYDEPNFYGGLSYLKLGEKEKASAKMREILQKFPDGAYALKAKSVLSNIQ